MLLFPNALCCSLYERNYVCAVTKIFTKFLPADNFCQLLRVTHKHSCTSAGNTQAQLHFRDDQQRAFGINNISNWANIVCFRLSTWQQAMCVLLLLFRRFEIIPSSRNTCRASLFVICCFTSSCPDRRDRTVDFGLMKNGSALYGIIQLLIKKKKN